MATSSRPRANAIVWQDQARHCPLCSAELLESEVGGRARLRCSRCPFVLYSNPACAAAGVVFNPLGEVLLVRRAIEPFQGYWALPAGYQEIDEDPERTVVREVYEEAGLVVEVHGLLDLLFVRDDPRKPANVAVYLCRAIGGALRPGDEETEAAWFRLDALPAEIGFDNYPRILERLRHAGGYPESPWTRLQKLLNGDARSP
ncbi:MAG: NUDIX hydrolase [Planctomycetes bacterium]|nr:NUDIX hydrolase [Planctomycetota bacterium]